MLERWWAEAPETFSVARDRDGVVTGCFSLLDSRTLRPSLVARRSRGRGVGAPPARASAPEGPARARPPALARRGARRAAVRVAGGVLAGRQARVHGAAPARCGASTSSSTTSRPTGRSSSSSASARFPAPAAVLDGVEYTSVVLDFGPGLGRRLARRARRAELGVDEEPELDEVARELSVQGERVSLTPLEFGLLRHLREREGRAVARRGAPRRGVGHRVHRRQQRRRRRRAVAAPQARPGGAGRRDRPRQRLPPARRLARAPELTRTGGRGSRPPVRRSSERAVARARARRCAAAAPAGTSRYVT